MTSPQRSSSGSSRKRVPLEQRRRELTVTAHEVMARDGAFHLTTRAVASAAGIPHGTVHYAFRSKAELIRAVVADDIDRATGLFHPFTVDPDNNDGDSNSKTAPDPESVPDPEPHVLAETTLRAAFHAYATALISNPYEETAQQELVLMGARNESLRDILQESNASYRGLLCDLLHSLARRTHGHWALDPAVLAETILGALFGSAQIWLVDRDDNSLIQTLDSLATVYAGQLLSGA